MKGLTTFIFYWFIVMFASRAALAQNNPELHFGESFELADGAMSSIMTKDNDFYYGLRVSDDGFFGFDDDAKCSILLFDHGLKLTGEIFVVDSSLQKLKNLKPLSFYKTTAGFVLLCSRYSSQNHAISSYLLQIDNSGKVEKVLNPATVEHISKTDIEFDFFQLDEMQPDSGRQFVFSVKAPSSLDISEKVDFNIYDEKLDLKGNRLLDYPDDVVSYNIIEIIAGENGLFYIRVEIFNPYKPEDLIHQLVVYDINKDDFNAFEFKFEGAIVKKSGLFKAEKNVVGLSGYFVKDSYSEEPEGIFYYLFDSQKGNMLKQKIHYFSSVEKDLIYASQKALKSDFKNLISSAIHITAHNNIILLFEYNWKSIMLIRDMEGMIYDRPYYYANEILLFQFDANNQFYNSMVIPKKQALGAGPEALGFCGFLSGNKFFVVYNDHPKNRNQHEAGDLKTMKGKHEMMLGAYDIVSKEFSKELFGKTNKISGFKPQEIIRANDSSLLFFDKSEDTRLIEIKLD